MELSNEDHNNIHNNSDNNDESVVVVVANGAPNGHHHHHQQLNNNKTLINPITITLNNNNNKEEEEEEEKEVTNSNLVCQKQITESHTNSNDDGEVKDHNRIKGDRFEPSQIDIPEDINNNNNNKINMKEVDENGNDTTTDVLVVDKNDHLQPPHSSLPKPEPPRGMVGKDTGDDGVDDDGHLLFFPRSKSLTDSFPDMPSIGKFIKDRSNSLSASIAKRLSSLQNDDLYYDNGVVKQNDSVTEFNISGLKVVVHVKNDAVFNRGRITFFSRSGCRDCTAVRAFFRERGMKFVEINVDVYPAREKELVERTGTNQVPQIFFNETLFGGLVALNSLRNSGDFELRMKELLGRKCEGKAVPAAPVYGFDDPEEEERKEDDEVAVVRVLRQRLPIQDRLMRMKIVKNCFSGAELVEVLIHHLDCGRKAAVEIGKQLARKHFIHHLFGENEFADGNHFYRFLEHEPYIPKCYNFRGSTNDNTPKLATFIGQRLNKIMSAILEAYASDDRSLLDYAAISKSEEFRRYVNLVQELQRVDLLQLSPDEKLAFFINLYNAMVIHAVIRIGAPEGVIDRRSFYTDFQYIIGGYPYSLNTIKNGILRNNRRSPYSFVKPFGSGDKRLEIAVAKVNPLIHFGLCNGTRSSPVVRFFTPKGIEAELRYAAREFFQKSGMEVDLEKRTVYLTRIIKWFGSDFGQEKEILKWIIKYLDATKAGLLTHLMGDGNPVNIVYQNYDWSLNS